MHKRFWLAGAFNLLMFHHISCERGLVLCDRQDIFHLVCLTKCLRVFVHLRAGAMAIVEYDKVYLHIIMAEWA